MSTLTVAPVLQAFVEHELLPGTGIAPVAFWEGLAALVEGFAPRHRAALAERERLQAAIDAWYRSGTGRGADPATTRSFLTDIGYLVPEGLPFAIATERVDDEIARIAGPQLVVPVLNARYALNAANARWGSLYDALYGTDAVSAEDGASRGTSYNPARGGKVIAKAKAFLDTSAPLNGATWAEVTGLSVAGHKLHIATARGAVTLRDEGQFIGYLQDSLCEFQILLQHHGLLIEILVDSRTDIGKSDPAHISDVWLESALTVIMDLEDSIAAVDAEDKAHAYRNWLGLMKGDLTEEVVKNGKSLTRGLHPNVDYIGVDGKPLTVGCRALMLVRNVGHLMTTNAVRGADGAEIPEGILDALITSAAALHDLRKPDNAEKRNSRTGAIYIVKPKMHGPAEVQLTVDLFAAVEGILGLPANTIKVGIMDEERRTSANLSECIRAAKDRVFFINTGFLDRTGDEMHTAMEAGPVVRKAAIRQTPWISAYEARNVAIGLACGFPGKAQIGKGMWAMPDRMADMMAQKVGHPKSGATTAWVPSPTAATLHALHYHEVDVFAVQRGLAGTAVGGLDELLTPPLATETNWPPADVQQELDNNAQGILGYVVRWVDQGIGCSKVPDIHDVGLMEDRATLRISAQHIANWLHHGITTEAQVRATFARMAAVVDRQNAGDPAYAPMAAAPDGNTAFQTALALVLDGRRQPSGYTEPLLHAARRQVKRGLS